MYIFSRTLLETVKLLCLSVACSAIFSMMIFQEDVSPIAFVCFVLNLVSLLLFLILFFKNWQNVYAKAFTPSEYWIPAMISFFLYFAFSTSCYAVASNPTIIPGFADDPYAVEKFRQFYRYMFQHSRFLEPMLNREYAFVSFIISQLATLAALIYAPRAVQNKN